MTQMNTLGSASLNDYESRTVTIQVSGVCHQSVLKSGSYQVRVPYSQMTQTLQNINRRGGRVTSVQLSNNPPATRSDSTAEQSVAAESPNNAEPTSSNAKSRKKASKRKQK